MDDAERILIIEDEKSILNFLSISLKTNGYAFDTAEKGIDGLSLFMTNNPDLILLDLGLPDIDGLEVLAQIRQTSELPVIIVSARDQEKDIVKALDLGADDYIAKPFHIGELLARIRVSLRKRQPKIVKEEIFSRGDLKIDFTKRRVTVDEKEIHLTPIEYRLLLLMIEHSGKVLTHNFISREVWGHTAVEDFQSLRVFMASIRRKIEKNTAAPRYILTEVGVGYRFAEE